MYRARRTRDLGSSFTFGGRLPAAVGFVLVLVFVASILGWVTNGELWAALRTGTIVDGQLWRLVTYSLVQLDPLSLVFGCLAIYFFGPTLAYDWGERRFLWVQLVIAVGAALVTLFLGAVLRVSVLHLGIWALLDGLIYSWALRYPHQQVLIYFVLPVTGRMLGIITLAINGLFLFFGVAKGGLAGLVQYTPPIAALGVAYVLERGRLRLPFRRWRLGLREWRLERKLRRRSRHLQVVGKDGARGKQWLN